MKKCKILEVLANYFMIKPLENMAHTLLEMAYNRGFLSGFSQKKDVLSAAHFFFLPISGFYT